MIKAASRVSAELPSANLAKSNFTEGISKGWEDLDWTALIKVFKQ
jgi:3-hydroxyisobutyrate dehydrogenase-like beta-hydroxyacid dehydrogenase